MRAGAGFAVSLILVSNACDEHDLNCTKTALPPKDVRRTCKYRVRNDQIFNAVFPSIFQMNIGDKCSWLDDVAGFSFMCEDCSRSHQPCNNSHAACGGCSCSESNYAKDAGEYFQDFMKLLGTENMTTHLTCDYIKEAFMFPNYNVVECEDEKEDRAPEGNISAIRVDVDDSWNESVLESGIIHGGCQVFPHKIGCKKVPFILKFECDDCVNKGSRAMLTKCCNRCKKFVDGLASNPNIPNNTLPIAFCSGCDSKFYTFEDSPMPEWPQAHWRDYSRFTEYTEAKAVEKWETYIEENVCTHLTKHCDVAATEWVGDDEVYTEECHTGSCPADPRPDDANWDYGQDRRLESLWEDRRLESIEPISEEMNNTQSVPGSLFWCPVSFRNYRTSWEPLDPPSSPSPELEPKAIIKTTMGLPGPLEMYQTAEAKTALRHGFANTLQDVLESWITVSVNAAGAGRQLSVVDFSSLCNLSRRLSVATVEFTINVPSTSTVAATAITQNVKSVAVDTSALATNLAESFAEYAPAIDVTTVDFNEAVVSEPVIIVREDPEESPVQAEESPTGTPLTGIQRSDPVPRFAIVGAAGVLVVGLIGAGLIRRNKKNNAEESRAAQGQEAGVVGNPVVPQEEKEEPV